MEVYHIRRNIMTGSIVKLTEELLSNIMSVIKSEIKNRDGYIIEAAVAGGRGFTQMAMSSTMLTSFGGKYGDIVRSSDGKYFYSKGGKYTLITIDNLSSLVGEGFFASAITIPNSYWTSATPFKDNCGYLSAIARGETVHNHTKWLLMMTEDGEDQLFTAGTDNNASYYGTHQFKYGKPMGMWELWLPRTLASGKVLIDY